MFNLINALRGYGYIKISGDRYTKLRVIGWTLIIGEDGLVTILRYAIAPGRTMEALSIDHDLTPQDALDRLLRHEGQSVRA